MLRKLFIIFIFFNIVIIIFIRDLEYVFPPSILLPLLSQSNGIPLLFAIVTSTGHVYLEEFTDALYSLDWTLPVGISPTLVANNTTDTNTTPINIITNTTSSVTIPLESSLEVDSSTNEETKKNDEIDNTPENFVEQDNNN